MAKQLATKERARRPSVLHQFPALGAVAAQKGIFTLGELSRRVERTGDVIAEVLRKEKRAEPTEKRIAEVLGVSLPKLRRLCEEKAAA